MSGAVILSEGVLGNTYGKTANGLCRFSERYRIVAVIDSTKIGQKLTDLVPLANPNIKIISSVKEAADMGCDTLIMGVATDGGYIPDNFKKLIMEGIKAGMNIVSGLHEYVGTIPEFAREAEKKGVTITDVRRMFSERRDMFTGRIWKIKSKRIAVLGTDSAVGKRTTAVYLNREINKKGHSSVMIGTGQTAWMQGFKHTLVVDSMINDFIPGGIESTILEAYDQEHPEYMILEGQGSVLHPVYPGSFELISAGSPHAIILQHSPSRKSFDGFDDIKMPPLERFISILELLSDRKVIAITLNRENLTVAQVKREKEKLMEKFMIPVLDPLNEPDRLAEIVLTTVR